jgi:hypothetical protein
MRKKLSIFFCFSLLCNSTEIWTQGLMLLGRNNMTWDIPSSFMCWVFFSGSLWVSALHCNLPTYASSIVAIKEVSHHTELNFWDGDLLTFLFRIALNPDILDFCLPRSWDYRCTPLQTMKLFFVFHKIIHNYCGLLEPVLW